MIFQTVYSGATSIFTSANMFEALGIDWQSMLFHFAALAILAVGLFLLLFKPIKKMIANHNQKIEDIVSENNRLSADAEAAKDKYAAMEAEVKKEALRVGVEAAQKAEERASAVVSDAEEQAANILRQARSEAKAEKQRLESDFDKSVSKAAVEIAGKVLMREVSEKDNKKLIDSCLSEWEK